MAAYERAHYMGDRVSAESSGVTTPLSNVQSYPLSESDAAGETVWRSHGIM